MLIQHQISTFVLISAGIMAAENSDLLSETHYVFKWWYLTNLHITVIRQNVK